MAESTEPQAGGAPAENPLQGVRVLAVDDEVDILETIEDVLEGADVTRASSYEEGIAQLGSGKEFDLAILDIMGVDGLTLLAETVNRGIPTVMLTAHAMNQDTLKTAIQKGALAYLPKEELARLDKFVVDFLAAHRRGESTWALLFDRLGAFFERSFGPQWRSDDPEFWKYYYYPFS
jgi:CheY-like chemotaxis protein